MEVKLIMNRTHLMDPLKTSRQHGMELITVELLDAMKTHHCRALNCSAMTGENLLKGIDWMLDDISDRIFMKD